MAETNTTLQSNYSPIKHKYIKKKSSPSQGRIEKAQCKGRGCRKQWTSGGISLPHPHPQLVLGPGLQCPWLSKQYTKLSCYESTVFHPRGWNACLFIIFQQPLSWRPWKEGVHRVPNRPECLMFPSLLLSSSLSLPCLLLNIRWTGDLLYSEEYKTNKDSEQAKTWGWNPNV